MISPCMAIKLCSQLTLATQLVCCSATIYFEDLDVTSTRVKVNHDLDTWSHRYFSFFVFRSTRKKRKKDYRWDFKHKVQARFSPQG
jgi:hypothetical protein